MTLNFNQSVETVRCLYIRPPPFKSLVPLRPHKCSVTLLRCAMLMLVTTLCLAFSDADIEVDFNDVLYSQHLSNNQHLARKLGLIRYMGLP